MGRRWGGGLDSGWRLDGHHFIEKGKVFPVCGNTYHMLHDTRFAPHFEQCWTARASPCLSSTLGCMSCPMTSMGAGFALRGCPLELAALSPPSAAAVMVLSPDYPPTVLSAHCAVSRCACSSLTVLCPTSVLSLSHHGAACLTVLSGS